MKSSHTVMHLLGSTPVWLAGVSARLHPECDFIYELRKAELRCRKEIKADGNQTTGGCQKMWDAVLCWPRASVGETVTVSCPQVFLHYMKQAGSVKRNCSSSGWSEPFPPYYSACAVDDEIPENEQSYFDTVKVIYTVGYSTSIISLSVAVIILIFFRRLHCARNYIHIQLFTTFILKAIAVFIKDAVLFSNDIDHCSYSTAGCKASVVFCHYCVMTNFFWLLVEALYLNSLLVSSFPQGNRFYWWFVLLGWGVPTLFIVVWIITRLHFENTECWDINEDSPYWWILKGPIVISIGVNFILFMNIIRILFKKLDPRRIHFNHSSQYRRLAKSTLLLIPLFGIHYVFFNFLPDYSSVEARIYIELCFGSFQGFVVAILYCFLNQEVQTEVSRRWQRWHINSYAMVAVVAKESQMDTPF
ncbi:growth hormone releasing hormone receptor, like [Latimeria chalumnae]|uniref:growth hormone releasing hormone receptor, like n=1 Tax=Latimeria chalumnae TaxID=7897 RepID=UPI00313C46F6